MLAAISSTDHAGEHCCGPWRWHKTTYSALLAALCVVLATEIRLCRVNFFDTLHAIALSLFSLFPMARCDSAVLLRVQDGPGIVVVRCVFRFAVWVRRKPCWARLAVVLGRRWPCFGSSWALLGPLSWALLSSFWGTPDAVLECCNLYSHQLIDSSILQPMARQHFASRPGGLLKAMK